VTDPTVDRTVRLPPPVLPGAVVGVAALSGPVAEQPLAEGLEALAALGFEPRLAENARDRAGLFAGSDEVRVDGLHRLLRDPDVEALFFLRGGHGVLRILPRIDWELLARRPIAFVGYSDLTPLLNLVPQRLRVAAFHGPMVATDLARGLLAQEASSLLAMLAGELPARYPLQLLSVPEGLRGPVTGPVVGGCLSMLAATLGTPYAPSLDGSLLVLEDVNEPLYRRDRLLTHLYLSGSLKQVSALVVGHFEAAGESPLEGWWELLAEIGRSSGIPVAVGLPLGHARPNLTMPLGLTGTLCLERQELSIGGR
jgi:muramoyltetrapeptide carboxypeptidase